MELSREQALDYLRGWQLAGTTLWIKYATHDATAGSTMLAQITEVSACVVFENESSDFRFHLGNATFKYGPLKLVLTPTRLGTLAVITSKSAGLADCDGLHVWLESGHLLFIFEYLQAGKNRLESTTHTLKDKRRGGLLDFSPSGEPGEVLASDAKLVVMTTRLPN